jgi:hypothetical protein
VKDYRDAPLFNAATLVGRRALEVFMRGKNLPTIWGCRDAIITEVEVYRKISYATYNTSLSDISVIGYSD